MAERSSRAHDCSDITAKQRFFLEAVCMPTSVYPVDQIIIRYHAVELLYKKLIKPPLRPPVAIRTALYCTYTIVRTESVTD